tara:strand:- start:504 stop:1514 length:1011 start_codon:yes stop_codon:yes gene_type:complete
MIDKFIPSRDEQGIFETFSDLALCTLAITLVMLSLLATNIGQRINIQISENQFNMDSAPLRSYFCISETLRDNSALVHFLDADVVDKLTAYRDTLTQSRIVTLPAGRTMTLGNFLLLAPAIVPGIDQNGLSTLSPLTDLWKADVISPQNEKFKINLSASQSAIRDLFPIRHLDESLKRSRIYIESLVKENGGKEKYYVVIGHAAYPLPEAIEDGSLEWLRSFESGTADIYYLGDLTNYKNDYVNKRHQFFIEQGFIECAMSYKDFKDQENLKSKIDNINNIFINDSFFPLIKHSDAWNSYINEQLIADPDPPAWFYKEFLVPLGFDRMVMDIPEVQ